jgi:hypothetical protein
MWFRPNTKIDPLKPFHWCARFRVPVGKSAHDSTTDWSSAVTATRVLDAFPYCVGVPHVQNFVGGLDEAHKTHLQLILKAEILAL